MIKIHFTAHDGELRTIEAPVGHSLMESAINAGVPGIDADCGGACSCGTCHVYIAGQWNRLLPTAGDDEEQLLDLADHKRDTSRLACQINIVAELDGMIVEIPESQI